MEPRSLLQGVTSRDQKSLGNPLPASEAQVALPGRTEPWSLVSNQHGCYIRTQCRLFLGTSVTHAETSVPGSLLWAGESWSLDSRGRLTFRQKEWSGFSAPLLCALLGCVSVLDGLCVCVSACVGTPGMYKHTHSLRSQASPPGFRPSGNDLLGFLFPSVSISEHNGQNALQFSSLFFFSPLILFYNVVQMSLK